MPQDELEALKQLQQLQRERKIVVRACDKGAGVMILNFDDYVKACYEHLTSHQSPDNPYYSEASDLELQQAKNNIKLTLDEGFERGYINKSEMDAMSPEDKSAGNFYCNFKVHKEHTDIPPPRPIISGNGSITENIGKFIEYHIKHTAAKHEAFIEDTSHFLKVIDKTNKGPKLHQNTSIVRGSV